MNREILLETVRQQLREQHALTGTVRPLGEIVPVVSAALKVEHPISFQASPTIVPIERVAAFVDGGLDPDENEIVCESAVRDNSVLAEIIAAVRAEQEPQDSGELSSDLMSRLFRMEIPCQTEDGSETPIESPRPNPIVHQSLVDLQRVDQFPPKSEHPGGHRLVIVIGAMALAASVLVAFLVLRGDPTDPLPRQTRDVAEHSSTIPSDTVADAGSNMGRSEEKDLTDHSSAKAASAMLTQDDSRPSANIRKSEDASSPGSNAERVPSIVDVRTPEAPPFRSKETKPPVTDRQDIESTIRPPASTVAEGRGGESSERGPDSPRDAIASGPRSSESEDHAVPEPSLRWTEVSGILSHVALPGRDASSQASPVWTAVRVGESSDAATPAFGTTLRTFPYSRAKAEFDRGAVVMSGDTGVRLRSQPARTKPLELDLLFGAIALVDLEDGTDVHLFAGSRPVAVLSGKKQASIVVQREVGGYQIQVSGDAEINASPARDSIVTVAESSDVSHQSKLKRLPRWVTRPDASGAKERMILAQVREARDFAPLLDQEIATLSSAPRLTADEGRALKKLAAWRVAMAGPALYPLVSHRNPVLRQAALQRLGQLSNVDPRYRATWRSMDASLNDPPRSAQVRVWLRMRKQGTRPNQVQLEQMIQGLSVRDLGHRAMSDWLLRQFVANAPPYDPTWTGVTLQRGITIYRDRAGLPKNRTRPSAAARQ